MIRGNNEFHADASAPGDAAHQMSRVARCPHHTDIAQGHKEITQ